WSADRRISASTVQVRSPASCSRIRSRGPSETLAKARLLQRVLPVGPRNLAAQARGGKELARVGQAGGGEGAAEPLHALEIVASEHQRHGARLVGTDAVLPGQRAPGVDARGEDLLSQLACPLGFPGSALVVEDERVQVAVAGVEDVADAEAVL